MSTACRACQAGLEHCHGALIHHPYQRDECTEPDCFVPPAVHDMHMDCSSVGCVCDDVLSGIASAHRVG